MSYRIQKQTNLCQWKARETCSITSTGISYIRPIIEAPLIRRWTQTDSWSAMFEAFRNVGRTETSDRTCRLPNLFQVRETKYLNWGIPVQSYRHGPTGFRNKDKYIPLLIIDSQFNYIFSSYQDIHNCRLDKGWVTVAGIRCELFKSTWFVFAKPRFNICSDNKRLITTFAVCNTELFRPKWN